MNIGNVFKSERQKKLAEWAEAIASRARAREERAQAIAAAEADPDYQVVYVLGVAAKKRLDGLRHQGWDLSLREDGEVNQLEHDIRSLADPRIEQFLTWAYGEKTRAGQQIVARGEVRRGRLGFGEKGFLETNQQKVMNYIAAVTAGIHAAEALQIGPADDVAAELEKIRNALPLADFQPVEISMDGAENILLAGSMSNV